MADLKGPIDQGKAAHVAWGYTLQVDGKQERKFSAEWTKDDAQNELAARLLERDTPPPPAAPKTFRQVSEEYLAFKRGKGKRSIREDEKILTKLKARLGADTPLPEITAQRIAQYDRDRISEKSKLGRTVTPSTVNRELAVLRHLLRLAEEWGYVDGSEWGSIRTAFEGACREAKIEDFRFHDLRHTFASHFMMSTGDLPALQKILGHATLAMTMRYAHLAEGHVRAAMNALRFSTKSAHDGTVDRECAVSAHAPVAQVDRATVS